MEEGGPLEASCLNDLSSLLTLYLYGTKVTGRATGIDIKRCCCSLCCCFARNPISISALKSSLALSDFIIILSMYCLSRGVLHAPFEFILIP